jgi:hypothetical protein
MAKLTKDQLTIEIIMGRLRSHLNEGRPVTLYNTFKGVPISYEAEVAMIHRDYIGLIVHPYQAVCIKEERRTYLESKSVPALVRAHPMSIDYTNQVVMLTSLKVPTKISADLHNSWVEPEKTVKVDASSEERADFSAPMMEIAVLRNNRVRVVLRVPEDFPYARQDPISLAFRLAPDGGVLQVQGIVQSLVKIRNKKSKRLEVDGQATMGDEISILAYIAQREDAIMAQLDSVYQKLRKGKSR